MKLIQFVVVVLERFVCKVNYRSFELHVQQLILINDFDHLEELEIERWYLMIDEYEISSELVMNLQS
jgi:hypothetical protein